MQLPNGFGGGGSQAYSNYFNSILNLGGGGLNNGFGSMSSNDSSGTGKAADIPKEQIGCGR